MVEASQRGEGVPGRATQVAVALGAALVLSACAGHTDSTQLHAQAIAALTRWDAAARAANHAVFVPTAGLSGQLGSWEPAVGDNDKLAELAGDYRLAATLPGGRPTDGIVAWRGGKTLQVRVLTAAASFQRLLATRTGSGCSGCTPLQVTGARLTRVDVQTSRGPATAPAWAFGVAGSAVRITQVAVAPEQTLTVAPPPDVPGPSVPGLRIDAASIAADGVTLTASFIGSPGPASRPCGSDYTAQGVESDYAVVVIITEHPAGGDGSCSAVGAERTASLALAGPLGTRAVLEVQNGLPVPVTAG